MEKFEMLVNIDSISEHFEDFANEAINNFDGDYFACIDISCSEETPERAERVTFEITIRNNETHDPKGVLGFELSRDKVAKLAKILSIM